MVERAAVIEALVDYRARLTARGQVLKAAAVGHCIQIVKRL